MAVRIRLKRLGRKNRPFYRVCAMDSREKRDGKVIEELGTYDPMVDDVDARCNLDKARVQHWISNGALPTGKVAVLIKKYGEGGTHATAAEAARAKLSQPRVVPAAPQPVFVFRPKSDAPETPAEPAPPAEGEAVSEEASAAAE